MDWNKIKTVFILTFLILNIFLASEFYKLKNSTPYTLNTETSFEKKLKNEEITYNDFPKNITKDKYLVAVPKLFYVDELLPSIIDKENPNYKITNGTILEVELKTPYVLVDSNVNSLETFLLSNVLFGEEYKYWGKKNNQIIFYQQYEGKTFYHNQNGELIINVTEDNRITSYYQTYLTDIQVLSEDEKIIQPMSALEILYNNAKLRSRDKITKVELGYYAFVQTSTTQVLTPAWRFVINDSRDLYVHAIEGQVIQIDI